MIQMWSAPVHVAQGCASRPRAMLHAGQLQCTCGCSSGSLSLDSNNRFAWRCSPVLSDFRMLKQKDILIPCRSGCIFVRISSARRLALGVRFRFSEDRTPKCSADAAAPDGNTMATPDARLLKGSLCLERIGELMRKRGKAMLAASVARLLIASPNPAAWSDTGLDGMLVFHYNYKGDRHIFELIHPVSCLTLFECELPEDLTYSRAGEDPCRLHSFEADDFMVGFVFVDASAAEEFFGAVEKHKPRSEDDEGLALLDSYRASKGATNTVQRSSEESILESVGTVEPPTLPAMSHATLPVHSPASGAGGEALPSTSDAPVRGYLSGTPARKPSSAAAHRPFRGSVGLGRRRSTVTVRQDGTVVRESLPPELVALFRRAGASEVELKDPKLLKGFMRQLQKADLVETEVASEDGAVVFGETEIVYEEEEGAAVLGETEIVYEEEEGDEKDEEKDEDDESKQDSKIQHYTHEKGVSSMGASIADATASDPHGSSNGDAEGDAKVVSSEATDVDAKEAGVDASGAGAEEAGVDASGAGAEEAGVDASGAGAEEAGFDASGAGAEEAGVDASGAGAEEAGVDASGAGAEEAGVDASGAGAKEAGVNASGAGAEEAGTSNEGRRRRRRGKLADRLKSGMQKGARGARSLKEERAKQKEKEEEEVEAGFGGMASTRAMRRRYSMARRGLGSMGAGTMDQDHGKQGLEAKGAVSKNTGLLADIRKGKRLKHAKKYKKKASGAAAAGPGKFNGGRRVSVARVTTMSVAEETTVLGKLRATMERRRVLLMGRQPSRQSSAGGSDSDSDSGWSMSSED